MRIGMTYDLKKDYLARGYSEEASAEFDSEETIQAIETALKTLGHEPIRIGSVFDLIPRLVNQQSWDLVFNICEGLYGRSREAQVPALLEAFQIPYTFCDPLTAAVTLDKPVAKQLLKAAGLATPDYFSIAAAGEIPALGRRKLPFPLFVKPSCEGTGKGVDADSIVRSSDELQKQCLRLLEQYHQPVLVEEYLPGQEYTVGILGTGDRARVEA